MCEHTFVRWDNLTIEAQEGTALPGYREPAIVRHFDAPEALDTRFYEVRAKSALNRVPERSRMPFRWTINPYRGCSHACAYCLSRADTPILMADGRTRLLAHLSPGDRIVGTEVRRAISPLRHHGGARALVDDQARISRDARRWHRAHRKRRSSLPDESWMEVRDGRRRGPEQRPHLTTNNELLGTGGFAPPPIVSDDYRRGYLCGLIRGDGHVGSYSYVAPRACARRALPLPSGAVDVEALAARGRATCRKRASRRAPSPSRRRRPPGVQLARSARPARANVERDHASSSLGRCRRPTAGGRASWPGSSTRRARALARRCASPTPTR